MSNLLASQHGIPVVDADVLARKVVEPGTPGYRKIQRHFGKEVFAADGTLDRAKLGKIIFSDAAKRKVLNGIVHPAVRFEIFKYILFYYIHGYDVTVLDIPLLFESGLDVLCGKTICVGCTEETQLERLLARDPHLTPKEANNRIQSQMPISAKINKADIVVWNECSREELEQKVARMVKDHRPNRLWAWLELVFPLLAGARAFWVIVRRYFQRRRAMM